MQGNRLTTKIRNLPRNQKKLTLFLLQLSGIGFFITFILIPASAILLGQMSPENTRMFLVDIISTVVPILLGFIVYQFMLDFLTRFSVSRDNQSSTTLNNKKLASEKISNANQGKTLAVIETIETIEIEEQEEDLPNTHREAKKIVAKKKEEMILRDAKHETMPIKIDIESEPDITDSIQDLEKILKKIKVNFIKYREPSSGRQEEQELEQLIEKLIYRIKRKKS